MLAAIWLELPAGVPAAIVQVLRLAIRRKTQAGRLQSEPLQVHSHSNLAFSPNICFRGKTTSHDDVVSISCSQLTHRAKQVNMYGIQPLLGEPGAVGSICSNLAPSAVV